MTQSTSSSTPDPWRPLRSLTSARIALGRAGGSLPTPELLSFQLDHARARDAVQMEFDDATIARDIESRGQRVLRVNTQAASRAAFLKRPDLGRRLDDASQTLLANTRKQIVEPPDLVIIITDGLSAAAAHALAIPLLSELLTRLNGWSLAAIVIARFGRVALQDDIGGILSAKIALTLIGERPGLGSPDSLGAYLVHTPAPGLTDARRNCVSNIHAKGLPHALAADTICWLLTESRRRGISGVALKNDMPTLPVGTTSRNSPLPTQQFPSMR